MDFLKSVKYKPINLKSFFFFFALGKTTSNTISSSSNLYVTLGDYVRDAATYFTSDSTFVFLKGVHHLNSDSTDRDGCWNSVHQFIWYCFEIYEVNT